jgi:hypothetical protein
MDEVRLVDALGKVEWGSLRQPRENASDAVPKALLALADAIDEETAWRAYNRLFYAMGNTHAGTYYPIAIFVVPVLAGLIEQGARWPLHVAMNALSDLYLAFEPELGCEVFVDADAVNRKTMPALEDAIAGLKPLIRRISADPEVWDKTRAVAQELLYAIP